MNKAEELRVERRKLLEQCRSLNDGVESREFTPEEQSKYDLMWKDQGALKSRIEREENLLEEERAAKEFDEKAKAKAVDRDVDTSTDDKDKDKDKKKKDEHREAWDTDEYREAFTGYLRGNMTQNEVRRYMTNQFSGEEQRSIAEEFRALQVDSDTAGGFLRTPRTLVTELIAQKNDLLFVRQRARVFTPPNGSSLGAVSEATRMGDPTWTAEILTGAEDSSLAFGGRELEPHPLARRIKVSKKLLRSTTFDVDGIVRDNFVREFGEVEENAYQNGTGVQQPMGVFTAAAAGFGITTGRDVSTGNTATAITIDGLKNAKYTMPAVYRRSPSIAWLFHRDAVSLLAKIKDGNGRYIWQDSIVAGEPDVLLNYPVDESEFTPSTFTANLYVGLLADWQNYWIADALSLTIQVLLELYAETNQNGYIARAETDGMPVDERGFVRVKLGA